MTAVTPDRIRAKPLSRKALKDSGVKPIGRPIWLLSPGVLWLLVFGLAPLAFMLMMSFWTSTMFGTKPDFSFDNYARVIVTELYRDQLFKTLRIAVITTAMTMLMARIRQRGLAMYLLNQATVHK